MGLVYKTNTPKTCKRHSDIEKSNSSHTTYSDRLLRNSSLGSALKISTFRVRQIILVSYLSASRQPAERNGRRLVP